MGALGFDAAAILESLNVRKTELCALWRFHIVNFASENTKDPRVQIPRVARGTYLLLQINENR
jgi:hypothetical protein